MEATVVCVPKNGLMARRMLTGQRDALLGPSGTPLGWDSEVPLS